MKVCSVEGCDRKFHGLNFCKVHYARFKRYGDPLAGGTENGAPLKFLKEIRSQEYNEECTVWPFGSDGKGYGMIHIGPNKVYVHRILCEDRHGPAPENQPLTRHLCGNGNKGCYNPNHLVWGDQTENMSDTIIHGTKVQGELVGNSKLTENQVLDIYKRSRSGFSKCKLAEEYVVSVTTIYQIFHETSWSWLTNPK